MRNLAIVLLVILLVGVKCEEIVKTEELTDKVDIEEELDDGEHWVYYDQPIMLEAYRFKTYKEVVINFGKAIPEGIKARQAQLIVHQVSGTELGVQVRTKIRVLDGKNQFVRWLYMQKFPQAAYSNLNQIFNIPCLHTRQIRVSTNELRTKGNQWIHFYISGYLPL